MEFDEDTMFILRADYDLQTGSIIFRQANYPKEFIDKKLKFKTWWNPQCQIIDPSPPK